MNKSQELEEARRLSASQKRALKEALAAAAEREAAEAAADEQTRVAVSAAAEEELERLTAELAATKVLKLLKGATDCGIVLYGKPLCNVFQRGAHMYVLCMDGAQRLHEQRPRAAATRQRA